MNREELFNQLYEKLEKNVSIHEGMVIHNEPGHTREVSKLQRTHCGRRTARYYSAMTMLGKLDEALGKQMLEELSKLQQLDTSKKKYGCFRWYKEETDIEDSNAAFFIIAPLIMVKLFAENKLYDSHKKLIDKMLKSAVKWFEYEYDHHCILYYSNKILSDGAMLLAISHDIGYIPGLEKGIAFFKRWLEYTRARGWGWGENISPIYTGVILDAIVVAEHILKKVDIDLYKELEKIKMQLIEYIRFHDGKEFVPAIRSYNFDGNYMNKGSINLISGVRACIDDLIPNENVDSIAGGIITLVVHMQGKELSVDANQDDSYEKRGEIVSPRTRVERIFDDKFAYSWIGKEIRLGSINQFPVIPGCYQQKTWGLGWQSMPVNFVVNEELAGYLRYYVNTSKTIRTHPARDYATAYLSPALFEEDYLPKMVTTCVQKENVLIAVRSAEKINNVVSELIDEWVLHHWQGEVVYHKDWLLLQFKDSVLGVNLLPGYSYGEKEVVQSKLICTVENEECLRVQNRWYEGDAHLLSQPLLQSRWIVVALDGVKDIAEAKRQVDSYLITCKEIHDYEEPREWEPYQTICEIQVIKENEVIAQLRVDPHKL